MTKDVAQLKPSRAAGRPRTLILNDVLNAAVEIGLESLSMTALAARLGVGIATLYTYVGGVEELKRLVAVRQARRPLIEDRGQHWSAIVEEHVRAIYEVFANEPTLITQFVEGGLGAEGLVDELERFLALMTRAGFDVPLAMQVYRMTGWVALGAAAAASNARGLEARGLSPARTIRRSFAEHDPASVPLLTDWIETYREPSADRHLNEGVVLLIQSIAALRGEELPKQDD